MLRDVFIVAWLAAINELKTCAVETLPSVVFL